MKLKNIISVTEFNYFLAMTKTDLERDAVYAILDRQIEISKYNKRQERDRT
jgi:hypothetical protein